MNAAAGEARNAASAATSSAVPYRPSGIAFRIRSAAGFLSASAGLRVLIEYNVADTNKPQSLMLAMVKTAGRWKVESVNLP